MRFGPSRLAHAVFIRRLSCRSGALAASAPASGGAWYERGAGPVVLGTLAVQAPRIVGLDDLSRLVDVPGIAGVILGRALMRASFAPLDALALARPQGERKAAFLQ